MALAISSMVALAFLIPLAFYVQKYQHDRAMAEATTQAREITSYATVAPTTKAIKDVLDALDYSSSKNDIIVWSPQRLPVPARGSAPAGDPPASVAGMFSAMEGQSSTTTGASTPKARPIQQKAVGGEEVLWPSYTEAGPIIVQVFVPNRVLTDGVVARLFGLTVIALALILAGVAVADRLATAIVKPVRELAAVTRRLSAGESDARTTPGGPPEIADVGGAVNHLADRIDGLLAAERETLADLSHRLRTPLAALRLDADGLAGSEIGERIMADIEAMEAAVSNVIREVRAPKRAADVSCDLVDVARTRCDFWQVLAEDDGRDWRVDIPTGAAWVPLKRDDLTTALDQVMTNAFTYTPEGTSIAVSVQTRANEVALTVDDQGTGFPDGFEIKRGESRGGSTGLGLDIVQRTVKAVGGRLELTRSPQGGARVQLVFPLRSTPAPNGAKRPTRVPRPGGPRASGANGANGAHGTNAANGAAGAADAN